MPQVNVTVIGTAPGPEQKDVLFTELTELMVNILGRTRKSVVVSVAASAPSNWSVAGAVPDSGQPAGIQAVVKVLAGTGTEEQRSDMIKQTTGVLRRVLGAPVMPLYVTFEDVAPQSWGYDGRSVAEIARERQAG